MKAVATSGHDVSMEALERFKAERVSHIAISKPTSRFCTECVSAPDDK
jgi:hypothetical protein